MLFMLIYASNLSSKFNHSRSRHCRNTDFPMQEQKYPWMSPGCPTHR